MNKYLLLESTIEGKPFDAGSKAPNDINKILEDNGFRQIPMKTRRRTTPLLKYFFYLIYGIYDIWMLLQTIDRNSIIAVSYPINSYPLNIFGIYMQILKTLKRTKIIAVVHDITYLRFENEKEKRKRERRELYLFGRINKLIVHNLKMKKYLIEKGITPEKMEVLGIFDYLSDEVTQKRIWNTSECEICIAGNLIYEKAQYIYSLNEVRGNIKYNLYGNGYTSKSNGNVSYKGVYSPEELPNKLQGNFGLIWDGESTNTCSGIYGEYMKYNNPHKLSLYLASGLPVIVWTQSAIKDFVLENNVGFAVDSLDEIADKVALISEEKYQEYLNSANEIGNRLRKGYYTLQAIDKCMQ